MKDEVREVTRDYVRLLQKFQHEGVIVKEEYEELAKKFEALAL